MSTRLLVWAVLAAALCACSERDEAAERRAAEAAVAEQLPAGPATLPTMDAPPSGAALPVADGTAGGATLPATPADFDVASVPFTSAALPPFPFFKDPEGLENLLQGADTAKPFDRHWFLAGAKPVTQEGKLALFQYAIENPPSGRRYSPLEFHKNYENAIALLGGQRISTAQFTSEIAGLAGGREAIEKHFHGAPPVPDAEHATYLIRAADKEYWVHVSAGGTVPMLGFVTVLERQAMQSSLGFLDAAAMKKALDEDGRVALYINFDTDKATLRPDAQPILNEIYELLAADAGLKLSIEGHTDSTGSAERNRELAAARARSVLGALVGLGVDPGRLTSAGFGPDRPLADNTTEIGRAKNRRVELVKTS